MHFNTTENLKRQSHSDENFGTRAARRYLRHKQTVGCLINSQTHS